MTDESNTREAVTAIVDGPSPIAHSADGRPDDSTPTPGGPLGRWVLYPLLLVAYPTLALWGANVHEAIPREVGAVLAVTVAVAAGAWVVLSGVMKLSGRQQPIARAGLAVAGGGLVLLNAGRFLSPGAVVLGAVVVIGAILLVVALAVWVGRLGLARLTLVGNVFAFVAIALAVFALRPALSSGRSGPVTVEFAGSDAPARDIWYIIPDRYPRADTLATDYGFDNTPFLENLEALGFQVQDGARANYPKTAHSLAATWNLDYLEELIPQPPADGAEASTIYGLLDQHRLGQFVTEAGFDYVHLGSWWGPTSRPSVATELRTVADPSEFRAVWRETTALGLFNSLVDEDIRQSWGNRERIREISEYQFDELDRMASEPHDRPRLVMAHITVPHEPYVFNPDGSFVTDEEEAERGRVVNTVNQIEYVNSRLEDLFDRLVTGDPATDPIIVVQSDEGPHPDEQYADGQQFNWLETTPENRAEKLRVLSAWYLPGIDDEVPDDITGVNTWRFILDRYFGTGLGLLPDRVSVFEDESELYTFYDVTDEFE